MEKEPLISIAIASFNNALYLKRMVLSAINQTYKNTEIIIVDDGSNDNSVELLREYQGFANVHVFEKENGGLSSTRQYALDRCHGEFICFVDADDYLTVEYVSDMYASICKYNSDIAVCGTCFYDEQNSLLRNETTNFSFSTEYVRMVSNKDLMTNYVNLAYEFKMSDSWNKMYRVDFLRKNSIGFSMPKGNNGTDLLFNHKVLMYCPKISTVCKNNYAHVIYERSAVHRKKKNLTKSYDIIIHQLYETQNKIEINFLLDQLYFWFILYFREANQDLYDEETNNEFLRSIKKQCVFFNEIDTSLFKDAKLAGVPSSLKFYYYALKKRYALIIWLYHCVRKKH